MRERLIEVAIRQFGELGFDGASTREIAAAADTTMSNITYHFGGKEGLYRAAAKAIVDRLALVVGREPIPVLSKDAEDSARVELICAILRRIGEFMLSSEAAAMARFVAREQQDPNSFMRELLSNSVLHAGVIFENEIAHLRPELDERERRATVFFMLGMAISLRSSRLSLCVFMDVEDIDDATADFLVGQLERMVRDVLLATPHA
ncbi:TetR family transcriptional regulator [Erythrobacter sp. YT30]|uniref:TetR family transcriptional regulator n=1 Tax=Erythrobacter sp. YT30 TaxID=1735012 RepID=UPI00076BE6DB|nr:TetR family transcriptional regulator [Erythrobacter sp. YT30]KWV91067.1 hypothetical protein AUC45_07045 [Erythrobacter sp. YT30]